jgi:hypothetical protein
MRRKVSEKLQTILPISSFPSLRDFLALDHKDEYRTANEWLTLYENAKKQCKMYGVEPPVGTSVMMLRSGFGGPRGIVKVIEGTEVYNEKEFLILQPQETDYQENLSFLIEKDVWWSYFMVIPGQEIKEEENNNQKKHVESIL